MEKTIALGKVDYNQVGKCNCPVELQISWDGKRFSASGNIWKPTRSDIYAGGQIVEEVAGYFPENQQAQRILAIWRDWHLNDMRAGSPAQRAWLKANPESHYDKASAALAMVGLNPDPGHLRNGKPYKYGEAWLTEEIPAEIAEEIQSWFID